MGLTEAALLVAAGLAAGIVNAIAGGGSLITFPSMLAIGIPPVSANVSNALSVAPGYASSVVGSRADLRGQGRRSLRVVPTVLAGAGCGCALLLNTPHRVFDFVVPFLVLGAALMLAFQARLRALVGLLDAEVSGAAPGAAVSRPALLDLLLTQVLREWLARQPADAYAGDPVIAGVVRQIRDRPGEPWTVQRLSERAGLPRREVSRRFARVTGRAPRTYLTEARLAHGARLLRESDAPLAAIARRVGYSTEFAFGGAFRREYGISPGRFRRDAAL